MSRITTRLAALGLAGAALAALAGRDGSRAALGSASREAVAERRPLARVSPEESQLVNLGPVTVSTKEELRDLLQTTRAAGLDQRAHMRRVALTSKNPLVVGNALRALGRLGDVTARSATALLVDDERPRVRQEAVVALGESGDPATVELLARVYRKGDPAQRPLVLRALGRIGGEEALELLREASASAANAVDRTFARHAITAAERAGRPTTAVQ